MPVWLGRLRRCRSFRGSMRPLPEPPESPEPLVALAKELATLKRARRGRKCTRMPVLGAQSGAPPGPLAQPGRSAEGPPGPALQLHQQT